MVGDNRSIASDEEEDQFVGEDDVEYVLDDADHPMDEDMDSGDDEQDAEAETGEGNDHVLAEDTSILHFDGHKDSVFGLAAHPSAPVIISGGQDDMAYLWDSTSGEQLVAFEGHTDTVVSAGFSHDGQYIATGGMDGKIRIWKKSAEGWKSWTFVVELVGPDELLWMQWHPKGHVLVAGSADFMVWMWQVPSGQNMQVFSGHTGAVNAGTFTPDGKRLLTGCAEGSLILWDPRTGSPVWKLAADDARFGLVDGVRTIAINAAGTLAVVGGHGEVRVVNLTKGDILGKLETTPDTSVEAVTIVEISTGTAGIAVTSSTDGKISMWDLGTMRLRASVSHNDAVTTLIPHPAPKAHLVTSASVDRTLKTWDVRSGSLVKEHTGQGGIIHNAVVGVGAGGKQVVVSAGDEGVCLVFDTE